AGRGGRASSAAAGDRESGEGFWQPGAGGAQKWLSCRRWEGLDMFKLKIGHKLGAIVLLMGIPIVTLVYLFIDSQNRQIAATQNELAGVEYLTAMRDLLELLPNYRAASAAAANGDAKARQEVERLQPEIDARMAAVTDVDS